MLYYKGLRVLCCFGLLSGPVFAQCYDLTSAHLYDVKGRFQEQWNRPIWNAKPGEGNFHLDETDWMGGVAEYVIFAIGQVQRTEAGWVPRRKSVVPEGWCDWTPQRSDVICYWPPYQTPSANAFEVPPREHSANTWTLTRDGLLRFSIAPGGDRPLTNSNANVDAMVKYLNLPRDLAFTFEAVLDLNTGAYSVVSHSRFTGYFRRFPPGGAEIVRDTEFSAKVSLAPQPCSVSLRKATLKAELQNDEAPPVPICAARVKMESGASRLEFIINPKNATSAEGCVVAHETPMPAHDSRLAQAPEQR